MPKSTFISPSFADLTNIYMIRMGLKNKDMPGLLQITPSTWGRYKASPGSMPMAILKLYIHALQLTPAEVVEVVEAWR